MCITLLCRQSVPLDSFGKVLLHALALGVRNAQVVLPLCISLVCRQSVPLGSLGKVLLHAVAPIVRRAQVVLCDCVPLSCRQSVPLGSLGKVLLHALTLPVHIAQDVLFFRPPVSHCRRHESECTCVLLPVVEEHGHVRERLSPEKLSLLCSGVCHIPTLECEPCHLLAFSL